MLPYRRALASDIAARELDDELELAARDFEDADALAQRDFDDALERRLLNWYHKWQAGRASMKADKYSAQAERQLKAAGVPPQAPADDSSAAGQ